MQKLFNPYHEWLGLDARSGQPNYYELLGIDPTLMDAHAIAAAADRAASRVRKFRPGEHAPLWAELLDEIAEAKQCLLDPQQRSQYDKRLKKEGQEGRKARPKATLVGPPTPQVPPPSNVAQPAIGQPAFGQPAIGQSGIGQPAIAQPAIDPQAPFAAPSSGGIPMLQPLPDPMAPLAPLSGSPQAAYVAPAGFPPGLAHPQLSSPMAPWQFPDPQAPVMLPHVPAAHPPAPAMPSAGTAPMAGVPMPAVPVAGVPTSVPPAAAAPAVPSATPAQYVSNAAVRTKTASAKSMGMLLPVLGGAVAGLVLLAGFVGYRLWSQEPDEASPAVAQSELPGSPVEPTESSAPDNRNEPSKAADSGDASAKPAPESPARRPKTAKSLPPLRLPGFSSQDKSSADEPNMPTTTPEKTTPEPAKPEPTKPEPTKPEPDKPKPDTTPAPESTKPEEKPPLTKQELVKLGRSMQKAREAIGEHEFDLAKELLVIGKELARDPEHLAKIERLELLAESVRKYHTAILDAVGKLQAGDTFEVGESPVALVEASRDKLVVRAAGRNRSYGYAELPPGLAAGLAALSLPKDDPHTTALKAAYVLATPGASQEELDKAREFLNEAATADDEVAKKLLPLVQDDYDLAK